MDTKADITIRPSEVVLFLSQIPPYFPVGICLTRCILKLNALPPQPGFFNACDI